ncbi:MAG: hypothetical protein JOZ32_05850 [Bryobacterales bacterium]|nr:hypothetical protein [Bryobacterales bacterium]
MNVPAAVRALAAIAFSLTVSLTALSAAPHWKIQYIYDRADSNFNIEDLECSTTEHCVAAGVIDDKKGHLHGSVVVTSDGGRHWSQYELKEEPISIFFLNDSLGWMVTEHGLWSTVEGGRAWTKVESRKGILQSWFLDANHGYIVGLQGLVQETTDGGKTWMTLEVSEQQPNRKSINYDLISFAGAHGFIIGAADSPSPFLVNPRSPLPAGGKVTVLETLDSGKSWKYGMIPLEGELARLKLSSKGFVVSLILYSDPKLPLASAVFKTPLGSPDGRMIFGERDRFATDIALLNNGGGVLAAIEPPGNSPRIPIPGKLKILKSDNLTVWNEMDVDYRAVAQSAVIAAPDDRHMWVATDTGEILNMVE